MSGQFLFLYVFHKTYPSFLLKTAKPKISYCKKKSKGIYLIQAVGNVTDNDTENAVVIIYNTNHTYSYERYRATSHSYVKGIMKS